MGVLVLLTFGGGGGGVVQNREFPHFRSPEVGRYVYEAARSQSSKIISTKEFYMKSLLSGHLRHLDESFRIVVTSINHPACP